MNKNLIYKLLLFATVVIASKNVFAQCDVIEDYDNPSNSVHLGLFESELDLLVSNGFQIPHLVLDQNSSSIQVFPGQIWTYQFIANGNLKGAIAVPFGNYIWDITETCAPDNSCGRQNTLAHNSMWRCRPLHYCSPSYQKYILKFDYTSQSIEQEMLQNGVSTYDIIHRIAEEEDCNMSNWTHGVQIQMIPSFPTGIELTGEEKPCFDETYSYYLPPSLDPNAIYRWAVVGGEFVDANGNVLEACDVLLDNEVSVLWDTPGVGSIKVECPGLPLNGDNPELLLDVDVYDQQSASLLYDLGTSDFEPQYPGNNPTTYNICAGESFEITISDYNEDLIYEWEVPFGVEVIEPTNPLDPTWEFQISETSPGGDMGLNISAACGVIGEVSVDVSIYPNILESNEIKGPKHLCNQTNGAVYYIDPIPGAIDYIWTLNGGSNLSGGVVDANKLTFPNVVQAGNFTVGVSVMGECGASQETTLDVEVYQNSVLSSVQNISFDYTQLNTGSYPSEIGSLIFNPCQFLSTCKETELENAQLNLKLDVGETNNFGLHPFFSNIDFNLKCYDIESPSSSDTPFLNYTGTLEIDNYEPEQLFSVPLGLNIYQVRSIVVEIISYSADDLIEQTNGLRLSASYDFDRKMALPLGGGDHVQAIGNNYGSTTENRITFNWSSLCDDYPNYEFQLLHLYNVNPNNPGNTSSHLTNVDWSRALSIETRSSATELTLTLAEGSGKYIWRVRPISNFYPGEIGNDLNWGKWSDIGPFTNGEIDIPMPTGTESYALNYLQFDEELNWSYSRTFVTGEKEDALKIGESISYANELLQGTVSQSYSNDNNVVLGNQNVYDYSGRTSLQVIPSPIEGKTSLGYQSMLYTSTPQGGSVFEEYNAKHFDDDINYRNPDQVLTDQTVPGLNEDNPYFYYEDPSSPDIASTEGYPYARTLFYADGRVREQGGLGSTHRIQEVSNLDQSRTTRTFYSTVAEEELLRIFGEEAPVAQSVFKVINIDPNRVSSGSYIDKTGRTLATFLIDNGNNPETGDYDSNIGDHSLIGLDSQGDDLDIIGEINSFSNAGIFAILNSTTFNVPEDGTEVSFNFTINQNDFDNECGLCYSCDYEVKIIVKTLDPDLAEDNPIFTHEYGSFEPEACGIIVERPADDISTVNLLAGNYEVMYIITTNNEDQNGETYLSNYQSEIETDYMAEFNTLIYGPGGWIDFLESNNSEESLEFFYELFEENTSTSWDASPVYDANTNTPELLGYNVVFSNICAEIFIPYVQCQTANTCEEFYSDGSYGTFPDIDFKQEFIDYWTEYNSSVDIADQVPIDQTAIDEIFESPAYINTLIKNMLAEDDQYYTCNEVIFCWQATIESYKSFLEMEGQVPGYTFDLYREFLNCTGKHYVGFLPSSASGTDLSFTVLGNVPTIQPSYKSHAYAFFPYDVSLPIDPTPGTIDDPCETSVFLMDYTDPGNPVPDADFESFYDIINGTNSGQGYSGNPPFADFYDGNWQWNQNEEYIVQPNYPYTIAESQLIWLSFESCLNSLEIGNDLASEIEELVDQYDGLVAEACFDRCNSLAPGFQQSIIDEYHQNGYYIVGTHDFADANAFTFQAFADADVAWLIEENIVDPDTDIPTGETVWIFEPSQLWSDTDEFDNYIYDQNQLNQFQNFMVTSEEIICLTNAMVLNCKEVCDFEGNMNDEAGNLLDHNEDGVIDASDEDHFIAEYNAFAEVMTSPSWEVKLPENGICTLDPEDTGKAFSLIESFQLSPFSPPIEMAPSNLELSVIFNNAINDFSDFLEYCILNQDFSNSYLGWSWDASGIYAECLMEHPFLETLQGNSCDLKVGFHIVHRDILNDPSNYSNYPITMLLDGTADLNDFLIYGHTRQLLDIGCFSQDLVSLNPNPGTWFDISPNNLQNVFNSTNLNNQIPDNYYFTQEILSYSVNEQGELFYNFGSSSNNAVTFDNSCIASCLTQSTQCNSSICFRWKDLEEPEEVFVMQPLSCMDFAIEDIKTTIDQGALQAIENAVNNLEEVYIASCVDNFAESMNANYSLGVSFHHYTLYYYDRAGNLIQTVPPEGVKPLENSEISSLKEHRNNNSSTPWSIYHNHRLKTDYRYNSLNRLVWQKTPDGGETKFYYDDLGRMRFSQNAQQLIDGVYSYTKYDNLSRVVEVGESAQLAASQEFLLENNMNAYASFPDQNLTDITRTFYTLPDLPGEQRYLLNRVSHSIASANGVLNDDDDIKTIYSYDPHGNVEWLIQDIPELGQKKIAYEYDLISGNVLQVNYQKGEIDQFFHKYTYDSDNRLLAVYSSCGEKIWDKDADYEYYIHGPLKRVELGEDLVQGVDYYYNLSGWLKAINHADISNANELIVDDGIGNSNFGQDAFGMVLSYFKGDFQKTGSPFHNDENGYGLTPKPIQDPTHDLYNGNIAAWTSRIHVPSYVSDYQYDQVTAMQYRYDELNRLKQAKMTSHDGAAWSSPLEDYKTQYWYDANGNLESLYRNGYTASGNIEMDSFSYRYELENGEKTTNRLWAVEDVLGYDSNYTEDVDSGQQYDNFNVENNNYQYDEIGNLTSDEAEGISSISWTPYGKIEAIEKDDNTDLSFRYGALGNRTIKSVYDSNGLLNTQYYVRDASGNVMAIYKKTLEGSGSDYQELFKVEELPLYGSSRLGIKSTDELVKIIDYSSGVPESTEPDVVDHISSYNHSVIGTRKTNDNKISGWLPLTFENGQISSGQHVQSAYSNGTDNITGRNHVLAENKEGDVQFVGSAHTKYGTWNRMRIYGEDGSIIPTGINGDNSEQKLKAHKFSQSLAIEYDVPGHFGLFTFLNNRIFGSVYDMDNQEYLVTNYAITPFGTNFGKAFAVIEDHRPNGRAAIYAKSYDADNTESTLHAFYIDMDNYTSNIEHVIIDTFQSTDAAGDAGIEISPDGKFLVVGNTKEIYSNAAANPELRIYSINNNLSLGQTPVIHDVGLNTQGLSSISITENAQYIYYVLPYAGTWSIHRLQLAGGTSELVPPIVNDEINIARLKDGNIYIIKEGEQSTLQYLSNVESSTIPIPINLNITLPPNWEVYSYNMRVPHRIVPRENQEYFTREIRTKHYELSDHLGNVRSVFSDLKLSNLNANNEPIDFLADVESGNNFYSFGMLQPGRNFSSGNYRYGFNGMEKDDEVSGNGNSLDFGARMYDSRIGRWKKMDEVVKPWLSQYQGFRGNPVNYLDPDGNDEIHFYWSKETIVDDDGHEIVFFVLSHLIIEDGKEDIVWRVHGLNVTLTDPELLVNVDEGNIDRIYPFEQGTRIADSQSFSAAERKLPYTKESWGQTLDDYTYLGILLKLNPGVLDNYEGTPWYSKLNQAVTRTSTLKVAEHAELVLAVLGGAYALKTLGTRIITSYAIKKSLDDVIISKEGIGKIRYHLSTLDWDAANDYMLERLEKIVNGTLEATKTDLRYFSHELLEAELMAQGYSYKKAHKIALAQYGISVSEATGKLYTKEALKHADDVDRAIHGLD